MSKIALLAFAFVAIVLGGMAWWATVEGPLRQPASALEDFYEARDRAEDQLMDPLILNGHRVVPLVIAELPNKAMPLRRYAIRFLGNGRYEEALPALEKILADESEMDYFRADALEAVHSISASRGQILAASYTNGGPLLGSTARSIVSGVAPERNRRSYWQAFVHQHD